MVKRKNASSDDDGDSSSDVSVVDITFDFFNPNPDVDYHAIKRLLKQLFDRDSEKIDLGEVTDLILAQSTLGTTIKADGTESDPYALLTVLNMHIHHQKESVKALANYFLSVTEGLDPAFHAALQGLFSQSDAHVGLVICERLRNMPVEVIPPMYSMLADEVTQACGNGQPFNFTHLIIVSRVYHLSLEEESILANSTRRSRASSSADNSNAKRSKKTRAGGAEEQFTRPEDGIYFFHPEDEIITKSAIHTLTFPYVSPQPALVQETRSKDAFGLDVRGRIMLVHGGAETLRDLGTKMSEYFGRGV